MNLSRCKYSVDQLRHLNVDISQNESFTSLLTEDSPDSIAYGKFKNIINVIYHSDNPVSLCNDVVFNLGENVPSDVKSFIQNWLLRVVPKSPGSKDDNLAFDTLIPRDVRTISELSPYLDKISDVITSSQSNVNPS